MSNNVSLWCFEKIALHMAVWLSVHHRCDFVTSGIREDRSRGGRSSYVGASFSFQKRALMEGGWPPEGGNPSKKPRTSDYLIKNTYPQPIIPQIMQVLHYNDDCFV